MLKTATILVVLLSASAAFAEYEADAGGWPVLS